MGSANSWINYDAWLQTAWGAGYEYWSSFPAGLAGVIGMGSTQQNPQYALDDFVAFYPKFLGVPTLLPNCSTTVGSNVVGVLSANGLRIGQFIQAGGLPPNTFIAGLGATSITVSNAATASASGIAILVYTATPIPAAVVANYINLAVASLPSNVWGLQQGWITAIGWFVAHYCTLYAETDASDLVVALQTVTHIEAPVELTTTLLSLSAAPPGGAITMVKNGNVLNPATDYTLSANLVTLTVAAIDSDTFAAIWPIQQQVINTMSVSPAQIAAQGIAAGILTSKSVGDVSAGYTTLVALEQWGAWNLTKYGQQLATMANTLGRIPCLVW